MVVDRLFPFFDFSKTLEEMDRIFGSQGRPVGLRSVPRGTFPAINIYDQGDSVVVVAEMPGVDKDTLELSVLGKTMTLKGRRKSHDSEGVKYYRNERPTGSFERTLTLADSVREDSVEAEYRDGILRVSMEKAEAEKVRKVEIKS